MKEKLYSIPVNDAFNSECECPICAMYKTLEDDAVDYTMGPSYMEDDTRAMTDELGFCDKHIRMVYHKDNRLGMAWVMKTHFDKTINDVRKNMPSGPAKMLKKGIENSSVIKYLDKLNNSCFVCSRINNFLTVMLTLYFFFGNRTTNLKNVLKSAKVSAMNIMFSCLRNRRIILKEKLLKNLYHSSTNYILPTLSVYAMM